MQDAVAVYSLKGNMDMAIHAYDYEKQDWVEGRRAAELLIEQAESDLEVLRGPRAGAYARMLGVSVLAIPEMISARERVIGELRGEL